MRTLSLSTLASDVSVKRGAITAMTLIGARLEPIADASRDGYISAWLEHEATDEVRNAALGYLSAWGRPDDLSAIKKEIERNSYQTRTNASNAFINISLRISVADAIHAVIELQPDSIAILAIHDGRAVDLINYNISPMLMEEIIDMMSIREFRTLGYDELEPLLLSNSTTLRRAIARKIALTFSKKTVSNFLVRYSSRAGEYYYNVIYWLDFGLSAGPIALRNASQVSAR